jgi:hypothetical protein
MGELAAHVVRVPVFYESTRDLFSINQPSLEVAPTVIS